MCRHARPSPAPSQASPSHGHADPNLTHAVELVAKMGLNKLGLPIETKGEPPDFGAVRASRTFNPPPPALQSGLEGKVWG